MLQLPSDLLCSWLDLLDQHPHKVLAFKNPYEAIDNLVSPATIVTIGGLLDKYIKWAEAYLMPFRDGQPHPDLARIKRLRKFMGCHPDWPVNDFGPDELTAVQDSMVAYRYFRRNHHPPAEGAPRVMDECDISCAPVD